MLSKLHYFALATPATLLSILFSTTAFASDFKNNDEMKMFGMVSDAYSKCAAYYDLSAAVSITNHQKKAANENRVFSYEMSKTIAKNMFAGKVKDESKREKAAKSFADQGYREALDKMTKQMKEDESAYLKQFAAYRDQCKIGVDDPGAFGKLILNKPTEKPKKKLPALKSFGNLKVVDANAKLPSSLSKMSCSSPDLNFKLSLDELIIKDKLICESKDQKLCDSNAKWLTHDEYAKKKFPKRTIKSVSKTQLFTSKDGKTSKTNHLNVCVSTK